MNQGKFGSVKTMTELRQNLPQRLDAPAEPKARSRHAAITQDLYSYRRYKHWMISLRASWEKS